MAARLLHGIPMSTPDTGAAQLDRLHAAGLRVRLLPPLQDVDTPEDACEVAAAAPATHFAGTLRALNGNPAGNIDGIGVTGVGPRSMITELRPRSARQPEAPVEGPRQEWA